jgi:signal transduction histidine kinase
VLGRNVDMLMPSPYREEHDTYLSRYLATGRAKIIGIGREVTGRRKDGTTVPIHLSVGQLTIGGKRKFTGILHDLSARVQMEARLREQMALAKLGEMAAVIAHEIKNPLAGISGAIQMLASDLGQNSETSAIVQDILERIDSLDRMTKEMLLFARPPEPRRSQVEVDQLLDATARFLREDPALRQVSVEVKGVSPPVSADPEMLRVVFQNLFINAGHAMQGRGRLAVTVNADQTSCRVSVADSGPGIPVEMRDRVFTPFFTTKTRGSGLGLPTAKRFVEAHRGELSLDCPPGGGTTVHVRLPLESSPG